MSGPEGVEQAVEQLTAALQSWGLTVAPEKVQLQTPVQYLGTLVERTTVKPQKLTIMKEIRNLHDLQVLVGNLQWLRQFIPITHKELGPLITDLAGPPDLAAPRKLNEMQLTLLQDLASRLSQNSLARYQPG
ncbi:hypothetical protein FK519_28250, partial [Klebsiella pneumoniae]|nr:hypothetical protein [Klebsiella pneumoniae]